MKTLLLNLPKNLDNPYDYDQAAQPIGLASISAFLKQHGCDVTLFDAHAHHLVRNEIFVYIKRVKPDIIGLSVMTYQLPVIISFIRDLKKQMPKIIIVAGGPHITAEYESTLRICSDVDIAVCGEGEITMFELVQALEKIQPQSLKSAPLLDSVKGIAYRKQGIIKSTEPRQLIQDINSLPYPDWGALPIEKYWDVFTTRKNYVRIIASRGCPYSCTFCGAHITMGRKVRKRSPEHIIGELTMLYDKYNVREFLFNDSTFNIDNEWVSQICEKIIEMKRPMIWRCNIRADRIDKKTLLLMKKSGCVKVIMGIESGDEQMLKNMRKGETLEQIKNALNLLKEVNISSDHGFILGMPGETKESMKKTINFAKKINSSVVTFSLATPFPGTQFYKQAKEEGLKIDDWSKFDFYGIPYVPKGLTRKELLKYYGQAVKTFYFRPSYLLKRLFEMQSWLNLKINIWYAFRIIQRRLKLHR